MKTHLRAGVLSALCLPACSKPDTAAPAAAEASSTPSARPAASVGVELTKELMTGRWAIQSDGDCKLSQNFNADGSVDGFFESWALQGSNMVVKVGGKTMTIALNGIDRNQVEAVLNGKTDFLVRC